MNQTEKTSKSKLAESDTAHAKAFLRLPTLPRQQRPLASQSKIRTQEHSIQLVYTRLIDWEKPDTWIVRRPTTTKEEDELIQAGFEYVRFDDKTQTPIYRKRK